MFLNRIGLELSIAAKADGNGTPVPLACPYHAVYERGDIAFEVPLEKCCSLISFSYHPEGCHPFVQTLLQYQSNPELSYDTSLLKIFYTTFQPPTVLDALLGSSVHERFRASPLGTLTTDTYHPFFPWDAEKRLAKGEHGLDASHGHQTFGPVSQVKGEMEFQRLIDVYESIKEDGYQTQPCEDGDIRGFFLRTDNDYRFVVRQGIHAAPHPGVVRF